MDVKLKTYTGQKSVIMPLGSCNGLPDDSAFGELCLQISSQGGIFIDAKKDLFILRDGNALAKSGSYVAICAKCSEIASDEEYFADYIYTDISQYIKENIGNLKPLVAFINGKGKKEKDNRGWLTQHNIVAPFSDINKNKNLYKIVLAVIDDLLSQKKVVLYGNGKINSLEIIYYALKCMPITVANKMSINTNMSSFNRTASQGIFYIKNDPQIEDSMHVGVYDLASLDKMEQKAYENVYCAYIAYLIDSGNELDSEIRYFSSSDCNSDIKEIICKLNIESAKRLLLTSYSDPSAIINKMLGRLNCNDLVTLYNASKDSDLLQKSILQNAALRPANDLVSISLALGYSKMQYLSFNDSPILLNDFSPNVSDFEHLMSFYNGLVQSKKTSGIQWAKSLLSLYLYRVKETSDDANNEKLFSTALMAIENMEYDGKYGKAIYLYFGRKRQEQRKKIYGSSATAIAKSDNNKDDCTETIDQAVIKWEKRYKGAFCALILVLLSIGCCLLIPQKVWNYICIVFGLPQYFKYIISAIIVAITIGEYWGLHCIMHKNTVQLNGLSQKKMFIVSVLDVVILLIPMLIILIIALCLSTL